MLGGEEALEGPHRALDELPSTAVCTHIKGTAASITATMSSHETLHFVKIGVNMVAVRQMDR